MHDDPRNDDLLSELGEEVDSLEEDELEEDEEGESEGDFKEPDTL
jgi:hypothetical protein